MNSSNSLTPKQIATQAVAAGRITSDQVAALEKHLRSDWVICDAEAELLFQVNHGVKASDENCGSWQKLFAEAISRFLVFDMNTPGEISTEESQWLRQHFQSSSQLTDSEKFLLVEIKRHATSVCPEMQELFRKAGA